MRRVRHARRAVGIGVVLACVFGTMAIGTALKSPCAGGDFSNGRQYRLLCYTDIVYPFVMALAIGAMPWGQWSGCHATPISADWGDFAPREMTDRSNRLSYVYSVMINRKGKRFVDEGEDGALFTYAKFGRAILAEPGAKAYQLFQEEGLIVVKRGVGMFVAEGATRRLLDRERRAFLDEEWPRIRQVIERLRIDPAELFERA